VPPPAVIPALIAYNKVAAVETLVVVVNFTKKYKLANTRRAKPEVVKGIHRETGRNAQ